MGTPVLSFQSIRSFARRIGRPLSTSLQTTMAHDAAHYLLSPDIQQSPVPNISAWFSHPKQSYFLEIGFGFGEHLLSAALAFPEVGIVGCEPFMNGVAHLIRSAANNNIDSIRIWPEDAFLLLKQCPDACFSRIYILFPDPWPKRSHHKRRIISPTSLLQFHRILKPGGALLIATDHADYAEWITKILKESPVFKTGLPEHSPFLTPPDNDLHSRYREKAAAEQRTFQQFFAVAQ